MSQEDETRWDRQHGARAGAPAPSHFVQEIFLTGAWPLAPGRALDVACGKGRNALFLAAQGFDVTGIDISSVALEEARRRAQEQSLRVSWQQSDLEQIRLPPFHYDLVINFNYLQRSLIPEIRSTLKAGGYLIFETYLIDQQEIGHPKNPQYLLAHNELLHLFRDYRVLCYREGKFSENGESSFRAGLLAQKLG